MFCALAHFVIFTRKTEQQVLVRKVQGISRKIQENHFLFWLQPFPPAEKKKRKVALIL